MELHPVWEKNTPLNSALWYVASGLGEHPTMRVGHTASFIPGEAGAEGKVYFIAGANPDGQIAEIYTYDLETFYWDTIESSFRARYEHIAFVPDSEPNKIYILLGAEKTENLNDIQVFDTVNKEWNSCQVLGTPPSPRTHHTTAQLGDRVFVYSGGEHGSDPIQDRNLYQFDASTSTWTCIETQDAPKPRHGHILLAYDNKVVLHGGMSGQSFYDDLHVLDLATKKWRSVKQRKVFPCARAAHGGCVLRNQAYIFGGMGRDGALDDLFKLDLDTFKWQKVNIEGPAPTPRLDFAMTCISARIAETQPLNSAAQEAFLKLQNLTVDESEMERKSSNELSVSDSPTAGFLAPNPTPNAERYRTMVLLLVHGGMDTDGEIWDDMLVFMADTDEQSEQRD